MKEYDTYLFDLDGTLLDTLDDLFLAVNHALQTQNMPRRSRDEVRQFVGNGIRLLMERAVPHGVENPLFTSAFETFQQYYLEHSLDHTHPYDGITDVLTALKQRGKKLAVVSNKFHAATSELCRHFFRGIIDVAIGEHEADGIRKKPAPDTLLEAMRQLGVEREGTVYVGDSDVDIATALNAQLPCISVLWGFRDRDFLLHHGASHLISSPRELLL